jgi:large conductance mechanosensitive channel
VLKGFKDFIMRGNLVELAVAFIIATAFAAVVTAFVDVVMGVVGKIGGQPDFSQFKPGGLLVGSFINAIVTFVLIAAIVYFFVVVPYNKLQERRARGQEPEPEAVAEDVLLLQEIRDLLAGRGTTASDTESPPTTP